VGLTLNNLAVLCKSQQRYAEAEALYRRSLFVLERALGRKHPRVATCRENYDGLRREMESPLGGSHAQPRRPGEGEPPSTDDDDISDPVA
jgi:hypothetical protein